MAKLNIGTIGAKALNLTSESLRDHVAVVGMTGSGKTGAILTLAEEAAAGGIPVILIDIKGDLGNIANVKSENVAFRYVSPGAYHGESVNLLSTMRDPDLITPTVTALLKLTGAETDPLRSPEHAFLSVLLKELHELSGPPSLVDLILGIIDPPFDTIGAMDLKQVISLNARLKIAGALNTVLVAPSFEPWQYGISLDIPKLIERDDGRTPVVVYSVAHLIEESERTFAIAAFMDALVSYMRTLDGNDDLRCMVIVDECYGLLPPHPYNPPTKRPIVTLLKQARAVGISMVLATQNPVDIDYKALSNCGTWLVGRLQTARDRKRVVEAVCATGFYSADAIDKQVGSLDKREFLLIRSSKVFQFRTRDVSCKLSGPMTPNSVRDAYKLGWFEDPDTLALLEQKAAMAKSLKAHDKLAQLEILIAELQLEKEAEEAAKADADLYDDLDCEEYMATFEGA